MSLAAAAARPLRQALRQPVVRRATARRLESTTARAADAAKDAAAKAQQTAAGFTSRASQGLSRVTSAAGPAIGRAASGLTSLLGRVGGRTGRVIGFVERASQTLVDVPPSHWGVGGRGRVEFPRPEGPLRVQQLTVRRE